MNPYTIPLYAAPALITIAASFLKNRIWKWTLLLLAIGSYWALLQMSVHWAYAHPFNPNDGAAKLTALILGGAFGLIMIVIPTYWLSKGIQWLVWKKRK